MRPPFPGMDPFIECFSLWEDFHSKLIGEMERSLSSLVPDRYVVRTGERSYVSIGSPGGDEGHEFLSDVVLMSGHAPETGGATAAASPGAREPETAPVLMQALIPAEYREVFLEIYQTDPEPGWSQGSSFSRRRTSAAAQRAGVSTIANVRSTCAVWRTLWNSTCSAEVAACPWRAIGRTARITCSSAASRRRRAAPSGLPIFSVRCRPSPYLWQHRPRCHAGPAAARGRGLCSFALRSRPRL